MFEAGGREGGGWILAGGMHCPLPVIPHLHEPSSLVFPLPSFVLGDSNSLDAEEEGGKGKGPLFLSLTLLAALSFFAAYPA